jgi:hypothetical protein
LLHKGMPQRKHSSEPWSRRHGELFDLIDKVERHIAPYDARDLKVDAFWEDERREADSKRKQQTRNRSKKKSMPARNRRATLVRDAMNGGWGSVNMIMTAVAPTLRDQRNRRHNLC